MSLSVADFDGFDLDAARRFLREFDATTRKRGEAYYRQGAVTEITCAEPGRSYRAKVQGTHKYSVQLSFADGEWLGSCTCPIGTYCKHVYAALQQLFGELGALPGAENLAVVPKRQGSAAALTPLGASVQMKLGRALTGPEKAYLKNVHQLFQRAAAGSLYYAHDLNGFGRDLPINYGERLELYPKTPATELEFWNFLALYLTDKLEIPLPDFMQPVTELTRARDIMRRYFRTRHIRQWQQTLSHLDQFPPLYGYAAAVEEPDTRPVDFRARFLPAEMVFEWRLAGGDAWTTLTPRKVNDFAAQHGAAVTAEAALLWLPFAQQAPVHHTKTFGYDDEWVARQAGRWFRQPLLRPLLVDANGLPLVFHEAPLRWQVTPPDDPDGDYAVSLVQADGQVAPEIFLSVPGRPAFYLTGSGVFGGPPYEYCVLSRTNQTLIPAQVVESRGGLKLFERLQAPLPPRLAARVRTVRLEPALRADVKKRWAGSSSEYCYVNLLGASGDGGQVEHWTPEGWKSEASPQRNGANGANGDFIQIDRSALDGLSKPLGDAGFTWDSWGGSWQLRITRKFPEIFVGFLKALPAGTRIDLAGELASFQNAEVAGVIRLEAAEVETDWFDLRVIVDVNDATLTPEEVKLLLDARGNWVRLGRKGWRKLQFNLSREEDEELARLGLTPHELTAEPQRLHALQLADRAARKFLPEETCQRIERRATELKARVTPEIPAAIQGELRPYQRDGFHFLAYLSANRFGGILADDMGLGKTLQTLTWIAWLRSAAASAKPSLVVCPKSVADNWAAEAAKFFPSLRVQVWTAATMADFAPAAADLHVLNYSQLRRAAAGLGRQSFAAVVLDEGQYIKNPASQTAQVARQLRAEHRLVLSGTPIENRLLDLWSLMNFAMPGALGSRAEFNRLYDVKSDPFARQRLSARVRPFLIRRTKGQVASDLPDRVEEDLFCELEGEQKTLYRAELKRAQAMLLGVQTAAALNQQRFNFLTSLLRLRQICCHPRLVKPGSPAASAKVEALLETLEPLVEEGEKVLVFSQFVELLAILRDEMKAHGWKYWYLAGDTENRGELVQSFQTAEEAGVFLISLKAGGFGLNLTAASYVVLFDPWWNPAVENQAIDRTHRIGQTSKVIAYRLLIKDSVEEKIRALQRQKRSLAEDVLGEEKFAQGLSLEDLRYLLAG